MHFSGGGTEGGGSHPLSLDSFLEEHNESETVFVAAAAAAWLSHSRLLLGLSFGTGRGTCGMCGRDRTPKTVCGQASEQAVQYGVN